MCFAQKGASEGREPDLFAAVFDFEAVVGAFRGVRGVEGVPFRVEAQVEARRSIGLVFERSDEEARGSKRGLATPG